MNSNNVSSLQLRNLEQSSEMFNRTDMRIYHELFPGREIKAQKFFDLNTTAPMMRSPSFNGKGPSRADANTSILSNNQRRGSASQKRGGSQIRLNKPKNMAQQVETALSEILASLEE